MAFVEFVPPPLYSFPPFFTLQPVDSTRSSQLESWRQLLLAYCAHHKQAIIVLASWPLFENATLSRRLSPEGIAAVAETAIIHKCAEWADPATRTSLRVFWKSPSEWATLTLDHMRRIGRTGSNNALAFATVYELRGNSEESIDMPMAGLDIDTVLKALKTLEAQGKVQLISIDEGDPDQTTVKFLG